MLAEGRNFADLAEEYSTDTGSKNQGGNLGMVTRGEMGEEFDQVAFAMQPGQISDPVKSVRVSYHQSRRKTEARPGTLKKTMKRSKITYSNKNGVRIPYLAG